MRFVFALLRVVSVPCAAWHNDVVVGGICCRFEAATTAASASASETMEKNNKPAEATPATAAPGSAQYRIYIMTLGVLAPYRGRGIGRAASAAAASPRAPVAAHLHC